MIIRVRRINEGVGVAKFGIDVGCKCCCLACFQLCFGISLFKHVSGLALFFFFFRFGPGAIERNCRQCPEFFVFVYCHFYLFYVRQRLCLPYFRSKSWRTLPPDSDFFYRRRTVRSFTIDPCASSCLFASRDIAFAQSEARLML